MMWFGMAPSVHVAWVPLIILYTMLVSLSIAFAGAAINVFYRDVGAALPVLLSLLMYASPVIYPLDLVKNKLLVEQAAGEWSDALYIAVHPESAGRHHRQLSKRRSTWNATRLVGVVARGNSCRDRAADQLPVFKRAESYFADVI